MMRFLLLAGLMVTLGAPDASAQFHSKSKAGETRVNASVVNPSNGQAQQATAAQGQGAQGRTQSSRQAIMAAHGRNSRLGTNANSTIYLSEAHEKAYGASMGRQQSKPIQVWGRAIHHSDGTYTESKRDIETNTLEQITKSENGTKLQRRVVMLDETGKPSEVMIYDGRNEFKYRGLLIYDEMGRFSEEQLYDDEGTLIRRKVQEYDPRGKKLPLRTLDYVEDVPDELKLVITRKDDAGNRTGNGSGQREDSGGGLFGNTGDGDRSRAEGSDDDGKKRQGLRLGRLFGGKRED